MHWEFWPSLFFYIPNLPYALYLVIKARHLAFFSAANPSIKSGGNGTESKYKTIQLVPEKYRPKSILHTKKSLISQTLLSIKKKKLNFPIIAKPDMGFRGLLVEKIHTQEGLESYLRKYPIDIIIQEFLDYKNECGIFYHRNPNDAKGSISSITLKKFLAVSGNGFSNIEQLILEDKRAKLYINIFKEIHQHNLKSIPKKGEIIPLSVIGNHSKGTQFISGNHLISKELVKTLDSLSSKISGWFYGRIDLKYNAFNELENSNDFKVLEINGIISEPTHIYDSENYTYFQALKAIRTNWKSLYEIATTNHKEHQVPYKSSKEFINEMFQLRAYTKKVKRFSKVI